MIWVYGMLALLLLAVALYAAGGIFCYLADMVGAFILKIWRKAWHKLAVNTK